MPGIVDIDVIGDKELTRTLNGLPFALQKSIVRKAMRPAAKVHILDPVKEAAPVMTGALKKSLKLRAIKRSRSRFGLRIPFPERDQLGIPAKSRGYYPAILEYGAPDRNISPRNYIRGTVNRNTERWIRAVGRGIADIMDDEIKKHAAKVAARKGRARG